MKILNLTKDTRVESIHLTAEHNPNHSGSSYGVFIVNSPKFSLRGCTIVVGSGSDAVVDGTNGIGGHDGGNGRIGVSGCENSWGFCKTCSRPLGGSGGYSSCHATGGTGGRPGIVLEHGDKGSKGSAGSDDTIPGAGGTGTPPSKGNWNTPSTYFGFKGNDGISGLNGDQCAYPCFNFSNEGFIPKKSPAGSPGKNGGGGGGKLNNIY